MTEGLRAVLAQLRAGDVVWALLWGGAATAGMAMTGAVATGVFLGAMTTVLLAVRRVSPRVAGVGLLCVLAAHALVQPRVLTLATVIVATGLAYISRRHLPPRWRTGVPVALVLGVVGYVALQPAMQGMSLLERLPFLGWGLGTLLIAALVGELRRRADEERAREVEHLRLQLLMQREEYELRAMEQRTFLAREVHDIVAHTLATIVAQADGGRYAAARDQAAAPEALANIARVGRESLRQMRGLVTVLRDDEARATAPTVGVGDVPALISEIADLQVTLEVVGEAPPHLPQDVSLAVYRIVQESLTNVRRHSRATVATVTIRWTRADVTVTVEDPGEAIPGDTPGHGLIGLQERVSIVGGEFTAGPADNGWTVQARLPCEEEWWT